MGREDHIILMLQLEKSGPATVRYPAAGRHAGRGYLGGPTTGFGVCGCMIPSVW